MPSIVDSAPVGAFSSSAAEMRLGSRADRMLQNQEFPYDLPSDAESYDGPHESDASDFSAAGDSAYLDGGVEMVDGVLRDGGDEGELTDYSDYEDGLVDGDGEEVAAAIHRRVGRRTSTHIATPSPDPARFAGRSLHSAGRNADTFLSNTPSAPPRILGLGSARRVKVTPAAQQQRGRGVPSRAVAWTTPSPGAGKPDFSFLFFTAAPTTHPAQLNSRNLLLFD